MPQVIVNPGIGDRNGHAASECNHHHGRKANQRNEDKQHQKHRHGGDKVVLIQYTELGHIKPVVAEFCAVPVLTIHHRKTIGRDVFPIKLIGPTGLFLQHLHHRVIGIHLHHFIARAIHNLVK